MLSNTSGINKNNIKNSSKVIGIQFSILSPEEIRKASVAHITTRDTYVNNKPVIGGLFDPRMGVLEPGLICPTDGLNYMQTPGYFGHIELARPVYYLQYFNHIIKILRCICFKCSKLLVNKENVKYALDMNPKDRWDFIFDLANKVSFCGDENEDGCGCVQPTTIRKDGFSKIIAEWKSTDSDVENMQLRLTPEIVLKIFKRLTDEDITFMGFSPTFSRPEWMICQVLAVPPPAVRPSVKMDAQQRSEDDISHIIVSIIKNNKTLQEKINQGADPNLIDDWTAMLQYYVGCMINNKIPGTHPVTQRSGRPLKSIQERLNGKTGRVRGNLMGKRVDYSARSVIGADPSLSIRQLGVPKKIAMNITHPAKVNDRNRNFLESLVKNGPDKYPGAKILERANGDNISLRYIDRDSIKLNNGDIVHRHMLDGDAVLFNRQPTLHRMSMMCHIVKIKEIGNTFSMNVADTKPYNADFDGDEMNMHMPQDAEAAAELRYLAAVPYQIISPANNGSIVGIFQDSLLGSYRFTRENINFTPREAMNLLMGIPNINKNILSNPNKLISNFEILSQILPPLSTKYKNNNFGEDEDSKNSNNVIEIVNGLYKRGQLDKSVKKIIHYIFNDFGHNASADFIDNLQSIITEYMKSSAYSVGISDLIADKDTNKKIAQSITKKKQSVKDIIDKIQIGVFENTTGKTNEVEFETDVNNILNKAREEAGKIGRNSLDKNNRFVIMVNAGSKGSDINIAQMISCLGQQNVDGKRISYGFEDRTLPHFNKFDDSPEARGFVENSFIQGLNPQELFFHAMGGRVGLIDTAVKTSTTGYIQRRLIKGLEDLKVEYDMTVRNNMNKIVQFEYGDDSFETTKVEGQKLPIVNMTIQDIYAYYQMPNDETVEDSIYTTNYTEDTIKRMKNQEKQLKDVTYKYITDTIQLRDEIIVNVFDNQDQNNVNLPVNFSRIIGNIKNQLNIQPNSLVDITPLECFNIIEDCKQRLINIHYVKFNRLFETLFNYYMNPKELLMTHRFNNKSLKILCEYIIINYKKSIVAPGEMVGMIAAQSIGEPTTQLTLNTFHSAGISSKSNVTRGVPRIEEVLSLSKEPKNPSITVYLKKQYQEDTMKAQQMMHILEHTSLRSVVSNVSICFDPDNLNTLIEEDKELIEQYYSFENMFEGCANFDDDTDKKRSKWIIRMEMDKEEMLDKNITMDDINFAIQNSYDEFVECIYTDLNSDKLIFRIRVNDIISNKKSPLTSSSCDTLDQSDEIYILKNIQENMMNNIILKGAKGIKKVIMRKVQNHVVKHEGNHTKKDIWVLDTVGSNLLDILGMDEIDTTQTYSNNIIEMYNVLGIEATRQSIYNELAEVLEFDGTYINYHHMALLADRMCCSKRLVSIFRHGINNDNIGPIAKASFEETPEMFLRAARHGEFDNMRGISANVMCGQEAKFGTNAFQIVLDIPEMAKLGSKLLTKKDTSLDDIFEIEDDNNVCSINNITVQHNQDNIQSKDIGDDNDYDLDF
jgi:DNA-directed RNA polymerase II subunit RPB1